MDTWLQLGGLQGPFQPKLFCRAVIPAGSCLWAHLTRLLLGNVSVPKSSWVWGFGALLLHSWRCWGDVGLQCWLAKKWTAASSKNWKIQGRQSPPP